MALLGDFEVAARAVEDGHEPNQFRLCGELFTCADKLGIIPLGRFAKAASSGLDTAEMDGLAAMLDLLAQVVIDEDRERFLNVASQNRADADDLMPIVQAVIEAQSGNPTQASSGSSAGLSTTGATLKAPSSSEEPYNPDEAWKDTPLGRRELAANPAAYANVKPIGQAAIDSLARVS